jgi:membrane associated rhomboid family serine protease
MLDRITLIGMTILVAVVWALFALTPCHAAKLTDGQIRIIQADIERSTNLSTECLNNQNIAGQNLSIATSNYQKTGLQGFHRAAEAYEEAQSKFAATRNVFDDAWIQMQSGMVNNDLSAVQQGIQLQNIAVQHFNAAVQVLNNAAVTFNQALQQSQSGTYSPSGGTHPTIGGIPSGGLAGSPPSAMARNGFPVVALIVLICTFIASLRAFKDRYFLNRYILHPWSIIRHKAPYRTLVTSGLIHSDPMHLTMNLMSFTFFALPLEGIIGHAGFFLVYFGSLTLSSIIVSIRHGNDAYYRCLGASGAISGIIFSYIIYRPTARISMMFAPIPVPAPIFALFFVGFSYLMSKKKLDNVAHDAHLWGALAGAGITVLIDPKMMGIVTGFIH